MTHYFYDPRLTGYQWKPGMYYQVDIYMKKWWHKKPRPVVTVVDKNPMRLLKKVNKMMELYKKHN